MGIRTVTGATLALLVAASSLAAKDSEKARDLPFRVERHAVSYVVNPDASFTEERSGAYTILKESALEGAKQITIGYSTSIQSAEMLEAYTRKPDGRRVDVPKDSYQVTTNSGRGKDAPVFSDRTTMRWVFPDVAVGDTLVYSYRLVAKEPMFEGHFSTTESVSPYMAYNEARFRVEAPESLKPHWHASGLEKVREDKRGHRVIVEWTYTNPKPERNERKDWSVYDPEDQPGFSFSTFADYEAIADAYGKVALPKARPTDRIRQLADEIVGGATAEREKARLLYEWVARNVNYAGNCIGLGAVVPRDVDFVLDHKIGDCKDKATLLEALLAAEGIESTQVLVNSGSAYELPRIPVVSMVNHVFNYIPSLDLYVDATPSSVPFGMLPDGDRGKPVLHIEGYEDGARAPIPPLGSNRQVVTSKVTVAPDGGVKADVEVELGGDNAVTMRSWFRDMDEDSKGDLVKDYVTRYGKVGRGTFDMDDPKPLDDHFSYRAHVEIEEYLSPGAAALTIDPLMFNPHPVSMYAMQATIEFEDHPSACSSGYASEHITYEFPEGMQILSVPDPLEVEHEHFTYKASYALEGRTLTVKRSFDDRTPGRVCSAELLRAFTKAVKPVYANVQAQVLYKLPAVADEDAADGD